MKIGMKNLMTLVAVGLFLITIPVSGKEVRRRIPLRMLRNSRQTPAIPALYSAPKPQQPEIPALYSAPKNRSPEENQVDFEGGTTETSTGGQTQTTSQPDSTDSDEGVSEDYQIADVTAVPNEDPAQNEFPTEATANNYYPRGGGRPQGPEVLYGPPQPQAMTFEQATRRPLDQQQIENTPFQHQIQIHVVPPHLGQSQDNENQINPVQNYGAPSSSPKYPQAGQYLPPNEAQPVRSFQAQTQNFQQPATNFQSEPQQNQRDNQQGGSYNHGQYNTDANQQQQSQGYPSQPEGQNQPEYQAPRGRTDEQAQDHSRPRTNAVSFQAQIPQQPQQNYQGYPSQTEQQYPNQEDRNVQPQLQGYSENRGYQQPEISQQPEIRRQPETHRPEIRQPQSQFGGYDTPKQPEIHQQQGFPQYDQQPENTYPSQQQYQLPRREEPVPDSRYIPVPTPERQSQPIQTQYSGPQQQFPNPPLVQHQSQTIPSEDQRPRQQGPSESQQGHITEPQGKSESAVGYLPPGSRVIFNRMQDRTEDLEGLNGNIVDAALLQRVQQIIEEHERQQKALINNIQRDNEAAFTNTNSNANANEQGGYQSNYQSGVTTQEPQRRGNIQAPVAQEPTRNIPGPTRPLQEGHQEQIFRDVGNNIENQRSQEVKGRSEEQEPLVEYQKAVLSTHFVQTEPLEASREYLPPAPQSSFSQPQTQAVSQSRGFYETAAPNVQAYSNPSYQQQQGAPSSAYGPVDSNIAYRPVDLSPADRRVESSPVYQPTQASQVHRQGEEQGGYNNNNAAEVRLGAGFLVGPQQFVQQNPETFGPQNQNQISFPSGSQFGSQNQLTSTPVQLYGSPNSFPEPQQPFGNFIRDNAVGPSINPYEGASPTTSFGQSGGNNVNIPRPVYGVPLAPVIGLDSNENLKVVEDEGQNNEVGGQLISNVVTLPVHDFSPSQQQHQPTLPQQLYQPSEIFYGRNRRRVGIVTRLNRTPTLH